jgi:hypothetical protein
MAVSSIARADDPVKNPPPANNNPPPVETDTQKLAAALRREEELKAEIARLKPKDKDADPKDPPGDDLISRNRKSKLSADETKIQTRLIEKALGFNMGIDDFVKNNADLLPSEIGEIVKLAHKETYDDSQAKASALKAAIIQSYFAVQDHLNALTPAQKTTLEDYLKLTITGKEQRAAEIYENIFEPALDMTRRIKKAEEVTRSRKGFATSSEKNDAYKERLINGSRRTHLGEKEART